MFNNYRSIATCKMLYKLWQHYMISKHVLKITSMSICSFVYEHQILQKKNLNIFNTKMKMKSSVTLAKCNMLFSLGQYNKLLNTRFRHFKPKFCKKRTWIFLTQKWKMKSAVTFGIIKCLKVDIFKWKEKRIWILTGMEWNIFKWTDTKNGSAPLTIISLLWTCQKMHWTSDVTSPVSVTRCCNKMYPIFYSCFPKLVTSIFTQKVTIFEMAKEITRNLGFFFCKKSIFMTF